ncbi:class I SAM-dependent methyltransferase [Selenihalanaerobacter shriftii]|uniref:Methyltransferase domain-containing protein n=1 Tax=Selenihalanaerobacter shriftii TaxID=142842 RepID=A0A1T4QV89_9FIRM|nr:methyltransferase domain-containing protein [Selenihalanaerobacter shriftii]SKA07700.1 Methyltransferase domain-containing protein [Selenihalanaerobacter shriftii]
MLELTEERVMPRKMNPKNGLLIEHKARYRFASEYCYGRLLDIACGVGYGSEMLLALGEGITEIIGIDSQPEVIGYAKKYYKHPPITFKVGDASNEELFRRIGKFDTIVSMETVEHIKDDYGFIDNLNKALKSNGTLVISTPFGSGRDESCANPYHYRQYREEEFKELLSVFSEVELYCQLNEEIEIPKPDKKYYLMVAVCHK